MFRLSKSCQVLKLKYKSEIFQVGEVREIHTLPVILGCKIGHLHVSCLGLSLEAKFKSRVVWAPMEDRIVKRLDSWKTPPFVERRQEGLNLRI